MIKLTLALVVLAAQFAFADWRVGAGAGYGATGITTNSQVNGVDVTVNRSDGPLAYTLSIEKAVSEKSTLGIDIFRGVSLGPFSEGVSFFGFNYRYYYPNMVPFAISSYGEQSTLMIKEYAPFVGGRIGLAQGTISRNRDLISDVNASGIFLGIQIGYDLMANSKFVYRAALSTSKTIGSADPNQSSLSEFTLLFGGYYIFD
jgi:hypothetical protein